MGVFGSGQIMANLTGDRVVPLGLYPFSRAARAHFEKSTFGNMPWLLFYAALAIPAFYAVGLLTSPHKGFVVNDFWRFWVVHLWVEDFSGDFYNRYRRLHVCLARRGP